MVTGNALEHRFPNPTATKDSLAEHVSRSGGPGSRNFNVRNALSGERFAQVIDALR